MLVLKVTFQRLSLPSILLRLQLHVELLLLSQRPLKTYHRLHVFFVLCWVISIVLPSRS